MMATLMGMKIVMMQKWDVEEGKKDNPIFMISSFGEKLSYDDTHRIPLLLYLAVK